MHHADISASVVVVVICFILYLAKSNPSVTMVNILTSVQQGEHQSWHLVPAYYNNGAKIVTVLFGLYHWFASSIRKTALSANPLDEG